VTEIVVALGAGDVLRLEAGRFRIDRVEQGPYQMIEAVRTEPSVYDPAEIAEIAPRLSPFVAPVPVEAQFMDLPLMRGDEVPHSPHLAVSAKPWPGSVAVYSSPGEGDFTLNSVIAGRATMGVLETPLTAGPVGRWQWRGEVQVRLIGGALQSVGPDALLAGANLAALGDGTPEGWELLQFRDAEPLGDGRYILRVLLRGQFGSDAVMPNAWPVGSRFVLIDSALEQIALPAAARGLARNYRVGPARRTVDDPSYTAFRLAFDGVGLRPFAPAHLRTAREEGGALGITWTRRSRIGGDSWDGVDVPLGEEVETYVLRIEQGGVVRREVVLSTPYWAFDPAQEAADTGGAPYSVAVAQVSATVGAGYFARRDVAVA